MKIIFFGTPAFATISLKKIIEKGIDVAAVVTAPDRPAGRGMQVKESDVKKFAHTQNIPILQPEKLKDENFLKELKSFDATLFVIVAFRMLPEAVWNMPPMGSINLHGSLLPYYRGAAPINWAIINGEKETGVTTFKLKHEIDTGDILMKEKVEILENDNAETLHDKMANIGANLLAETVLRYLKNEIKPIPQEEVQIEKNIESYKAPKLTSENCKIDWQQSTEKIYNLIRGLSPYPAAYSFLKEKRIKIFVSEKDFSEQNNSTIIAGDFITDNKTYLKIKTADGFISILELQPENKKRMKIDEYLRGAKL